MCDAARPARRQSDLPSVPTTVSTTIAVDIEPELRAPAVVERWNCGRGEKSMRPTLRCITELAIGLIADRGQPTQICEVRAVRGDRGVDSLVREATPFVPHRRSAAPVSRLAAAASPANRFGVSAHRPRPRERRGGRRWLAPVVDSRGWWPDGWRRWPSGCCSPDGTCRGYPPHAARDRSRRAG